MGAIWKATVTGTLRFLNLMKSVESVEKQEVCLGLLPSPRFRTGRAGERTCELETQHQNLGTLEFVLSAARFLSALITRCHQTQKCAAGAF